MEFKEFLLEESRSQVLNLYYHDTDLGVREIAKQTGVSIGEIYRIIRELGEPNRRNDRRHHVRALNDSGLPIGKIAEFTKYTPRNIRNILKSSQG